MRLLLFVLLVAGCHDVAITFEPADMTVVRSPNYCQPGFCGDPRQPCCCDGGVPYCGFLVDSDGGLVDGCRMNESHPDYGCAGPVAVWK